METSWYQLTQVNLENGHYNGEKEIFYTPMPEGKKTEMWFFYKSK